MIAIDSSAIISIVAGESMAGECADIIEAERVIIMSAGTLTEVLIVAARRKILTDVRTLIGMSVTRIIDLTPARAQRAASAYARWGKSFHPAALNYGDCFSYATAEEFDCPLLYVGDDFSRTDIKSAIPASPTAT